MCEGVAMYRELRREIRRTAEITLPVAAAGRVKVTRKAD